jgi:Tfp pilus assembly protein PilN
LKPIRIDFARPSLRRAIWKSAFVYRVLSVLGLALCVTAIVAITQARSIQREQLAHKTQALKEQMRSAAPVKKILIPLAQANAVNQIVAKLNLPWRELQDAIENATSGKVALLTLEPDAKSHTMKITAETPNSDEMLAYVERLKRQDFFVDAVLNKHEINEQDAQKPLRFQLEVQWSEKATTP